MKNYIRLLTLTAAIIFIFTSCSKTPNHINAIPGDAFAVITMKNDNDNKEDMVKSIKENEEYKVLMKDLRKENEAMADILEDFIEDPTTSGLDLKEEIFAFAAPEDDNMIFGSVVKMKKEDKFKKILKKISKEMDMNLKISDEEGFKKVMIPAGGLALWDEDKLLILMSEGKGDIVEKAKSLMNQKAKESITSNKDFSEFFENRKDLNIWVSSNIDNMSDEMKMAEKMIGFELTDNFSHLHFDWNKKEGQFTMIAKLRVNDEIKNMDMDDFSELAEQVSMLKGANKFFGGNKSSDYKKNKSKWEDEISEEDVKAAKKALDTLSEEDVDKAVKEIEKHMETDLSENE